MKRRNRFTRGNDERSLGYALRTPVASGVPHEFMERADSALCHLCWMPRSHADHVVSTSNTTKENP